MVELIVASDLSILDRMTENDITINIINRTYSLIVPIFQETTYAMQI